MRHFSGWFITGLCLVRWFTGTAQPLPYSAWQRTQLTKVQQNIRQFQEGNYRRAVQRARQQNRLIEEVRPDGTVLTLRGIDERGELLYDVTYSATRAGTTTRTNAFYEGGSLGLNLTGASPAVQNRLAFWDGGRTLATHAEFGNRVTQIDNPSLTDNHATHVGGILIAAGQNTLAQGMAPGARLRAYDFNSDETEMAAAAQDLLISNHSYGTQAGWTFNDSRTGTIKWEWWGDTTISATEDHKFGFYNTNAQNWDRIAFNAPYYLIVKSAGNSHGANGPAAGSPYYFGSRSTTSTQPRQDQNGYDQISTYGTAKNILTVGAISTIANGYFQPTDARLASFSSWGPTDDGRIKPDLVGVGVSVLSTSSAGANRYTSLSGTSMSSPNVAGSLLLLQEYFAQLNNGRVMRSSTLKGLAIHTAEEAGPAPGPDYRYGWGLLNTERAATVIRNADRSHLLDERTLNQNQTYTLSVVASGRGPLVVTICWTDPEGTATPVTVANLNNRTPKLINDLDIRLTSGTQTILPWVLDPDRPEQPAGRGDNIRDNVEQIVVPNPIPGRTYTLTLSHKGSLKDGKQDYALLISGAGGQAYCTSAATANTGSRIDRVVIGSIDQRGSNTCSSYSDFMQQSTTVQSGQQLPLSVTVGTCDAARNVVVKAFVDWNLDGDFDDAGETVATSDILSSGATFSGTLTAPPGLANGQFTRLRIVAVETASAGAVTSCGPYANGETQEYLLQYVRTANDVGVITLVSPESGFCAQTGTATGADGSLTVAVRVRNFGTQLQQNIPVSIRVVDSNQNELTTLSGTIPSLAAFSESTLSLKASPQIRLEPGRSYQFICTTGLNADQDPTNNQISVIRATSPAPANGIFAALACGQDAAVSLTNTGAGTAFWYDSPAGGNFLAGGNRTSTALRPANGTYYAVINDFSARLGPVTKSAFGGGSYAGNFGPAPLLSTQVPLLIESARLYIGTSGRLTFTVRRADDSPISAVTLDVTATRNPNVTGSAPSGQLADDPNDPGAEYLLNLRIPEAGDYKITIEYEDGASIFRSNVGVSGFPFRIPGVATMRGSQFNADTLTTAWYYFYDLKLKALGCPAVQRTAVNLTTGDAVTATITPDGSTAICRGSAATLRANTGPGLSYQWLRNGQPIAGATSATYFASAEGTYAVQVANACLPATSPAVQVTLREAVPPVITRDGFTLTSNAASGNQWLLDGIAIAGATGRTYTATRSGRYSVRASIDGCGELISEEVAIVILATEPTLADDFFRVFPNPAVKTVTVEIPAATSNEPLPVVQLTNLQGATLRTTPMRRDGKIYTAILDLADLPGGTFFVLIQENGTAAVRAKRVIKL
ncbi:S8 family serine peptidase [Nibrella viscosa]